MGLVLADSAYASGEALDAFAAAGYDTAIKAHRPQAAHHRRPSPETTFTIDTDGTNRDLSRSARFGRALPRLPPAAPLQPQVVGDRLSVETQQSIEQLFGSLRDRR